MADAKKNLSDIAEQKKNKFKSAVLAQIAIQRLEKSNDVQRTQDAGDEDMEEENAEEEEKPTGEFHCCCANAQS